MPVREQPGSAANPISPHASLSCLGHQQVTDVPRAPLSPLDLAVHFRGDAHVQGPVDGPGVSHQVIAVILPPSCEHGHPAAALARRDASQTASVTARLYLVRRRMSNLGLERNPLPWSLGHSGWHEDGVHGSLRSARSSEPVLGDPRAAPSLHPPRNAIDYP